jgi:hypothetical protein
LDKFHIQLQKWIGKGAFGDVWKGNILSTPVAVKFLQRAGKGDVAELLEETSLLGYVALDNLLTK